MFILGTATGWAVMGFFIAIPIFLLIFLFSLVFEEKKADERDTK